MGKYWSVATRDPPGARFRSCARDNVAMRNASVERRVRYRLGGLVTALLLIMAGTYLVLVRTVAGRQFDLDAYYGQIASARSVARYESLSLDLLTPLTMLLALLVLVVVAWRRGIPIVGVIAACAVMGAWVSAELIKHFGPWHQVLPAEQFLPAGLKGLTMPSGHTTAITALSLAVVTLLPSRWRGWGGVVAGVASASVACAVITAGWHRPSDAIGGLCWGGAWLGVACLLLIATKRGVGLDTGATIMSRPAIWLALWLALLTLAVVVAVALLAPVTGPDADVPFLVLMTIVIGLGYASATWFGLTVARIHWLAAPRSRKHANL